MVSSDKDSNELQTSELCTSVEKTHKICSCNESFVSVGFTWVDNLTCIFVSSVATKNVTVFPEKLQTLIYKSQLFDK